MKITKRWLKKNWACKNAIKEFNRIFPNGMRLTRSNLLKSVKESNFNTIEMLLLDMDWLSDKLLKEKYGDEFNVKKHLSKYAKEVDKHTNKLFNITKHYRDPGAISNQRKAIRNIERRFHKRIAKLLANDLGLR